MIQRLSIEVTNRCNKSCSFCYNHSNPHGTTEWQPDELVSFILDCAGNGVQAVSFGGGEPLQFDDLDYVLSSLKGSLFRSITSNGLLLTERRLERLVEAEPDKVHLSIHFPENEIEVRRVAEKVALLSSCGIKSGVNLLVSRSKLQAAQSAASYLHSLGIDNERIIYLPMRRFDTPSAKDLFQVAGSQPFQSMTCVTNCQASPGFCSVGWDKSVAFCSYTSARHYLSQLTFAGLLNAMVDLGLIYCGDAYERA